MGNAAICAYTGSIPDPITGAYPLGDGYRFYSPALMRFTAPDTESPFGLGGVNSYGYCLGNPVTGADPTGHVPMFRPEDMIEGLDVLAAAAAAEFRPGQLHAADLEHHLGELPVLDADTVDEVLGTADAGPGPVARRHTPSPAMAAAPALPGPTLRITGGHPLPISLRQLPSTPEGFVEVFNQAHRAGQLTFNPDGQAISRTLIRWRARIVLHGRELGRNDPTLADFLRHYGASRKGAGASWAEYAPYPIVLPYQVPVARALDIALGVSKDPTRYTPILIPPSRFVTRFASIQRLYGMEFATSAKRLGMKGRYSRTSFVIEIQF
ncbi:RHS repeat-associated core domain-containing protein [Bordetella bronchialis]|uniref:RHS repeat-associated core domain-containing protein n=1 Tax=Bordetella bronchialis TaxID=463025 RepID=UPI003D045D47